MKSKPYNTHYFTIRCLKPLIIHKPETCLKLSSQKLHFIYLRLPHTTVNHGSQYWRVCWQDHLKNNTVRTLLKFFVSPLFYTWTHLVTFDFLAFANQDKISRFLRLLTHLLDQRLEVKKELSRHVTCSVLWYYWSDFILSLMWDYIQYTSYVFNIFHGKKFKCCWLLLAFLLSRTLGLTNMENTPGTH